MVKKVLKSIVSTGIILAIFYSPCAAQWGLYLKGSLVTAGRPHDLVISGDYAYLGDWTAGLTVVDISDPRWPQQVYNYDTPGLANSVFLHDTLALVADWSQGIAIFDISDPAAPFLTGI